VDAEKLRAGLTPDEATIWAAYEANIDAYSVDESRVIDQITIPDLATAEAAMGRLVGGAATFESLGEEFNLTADDLSLGRVTRSDLPDAAADLVFGEAEPSIIGPVALPTGFAVYRIREINPGGAASFEDMRDTIARQLTTEELLTRAPEIANQIEEMRAEGLSMPEIAERMEPSSGVVHGAFDGLALDASLAGGPTAAAVVASPAFIGEVFAALDAEERDLLETPAGGYLLVMVERIEVSALQPLDKVRERATSAWQDTERLKAIEAQGADLAARLGDDASIWDIGEEMTLATFPLAPFTRLTPPPILPAALVEMVFQSGNAAGASAPSQDKTQVIVAQISSITPVAPEAMATSSVGIDLVLTDTLTQDMAEYFARAVEAKHVALIEPGIIDEVFRRLGGTVQQYP
jgi:peptidyl-prolyl cis-trans isomerase D